MPLLGLNRYIVSICDANAQWQSDYEKIAAQIRSVTTGLQLDIEHIGSTSVPGLAAKPIIDVGILLDEPDQFADLVGALSKMDLIYRGDKGSAGGRLFIRETAPEFRTHHVHVYFAGAPQWDAYLVFRGRLRSDAKLRSEYAALKRDLALEHRNDRFAYTEGKTAFVSKVLNGG